MVFLQCPRVDDCLKESTRFMTLKISQIVLSIYIAVLTFGPASLRDPQTGYIIDHESAERTEMGVILVNGDERAIIATSSFQVICIGLARLSAWFMYPIVVFFSKFRATTTFLSKSPLAIHMQSDTHELHVYCGWNIFICSIIHSICHFARMAAQGNLYLLYSHISGITGVLIFLFCLLICVPMTFFRQRINYELRKNMHYLFIFFALALAFHTPTSAIPNGGFTFYVFGTLLFWFFVDATYSYFFMTEKIDTPTFSVVPSGVRMTMDVSKRFQKVGQKGGICYVCLPWVKKNQWHAFSLFENPSNPVERQIFVQRTGDWTNELHSYLQRDTVRPVWINGPFPSPYDNAGAYDNQILVASGIGVTPALSAIQAHRKSRKINLIWMVRDPHLLDFILRHTYLDHRGWNLIFYTGNEALNLESINTLSETNVCIIRGRPDLRVVICKIIFGYESQQGIPSNYTPTTRSNASEMLADRLSELLTNDEFRIDVVAEGLALYAMELGFYLPTGTIVQSLRGNRMTNGGELLDRRRVSRDILTYLAFGFRPWDETAIDDVANYVQKLDRVRVLRTWGILYCGGAEAVVADLKQISEDYSIGLHVPVESFKW